MVKTTGPLTGFTAAGTLGKTLTFRRGPRGTNIVRHFVPHDPGTPAQLGVRALMRLLQTIWTPLLLGYKQNWLPTPESSLHEAYLAYLSRNLLEFRNFLAPLPNPTRLTTTLSWSHTTLIATALVHSINLKVNTVLNNLPGRYLIYRRLGDIPNEQQSELIGGTYTDANARLDYTDVVPTLDSYGYRVNRYDLNGQRATSKTFAPTSPLDA